MPDTEDHLIVIADARAQDLRLDAFLANAMDGVSRAQLQKLIDAGYVSVNSAPAKKNRKLKPGDRISVDKRRSEDAVNPQLKPQAIDLDILYQDEWLLAINKPAGMVVHPGHGNRDGTVVNALLHHMPALSDGFAPDRPGIVHRLDKETSGVLLSAKTNEAHARLAGLFSSRTIRKYYLGVCLGDRPAEQGTIDAPIGRSRRDPIKHVVRADGRGALTEYRLLSHKSGLSFMAFRLHTGRTHQIRIHCAHKNFPIVGDAVYGKQDDLMQQIQPLDRPFAYKVIKCFSRQALHAWRIAFVHPFTLKEIALTAPLPEDFMNAARLFGVDAARLDALISGF
jgi:23S rRNA pseudouridine1911/1915/1917 synthase